MFIKINTLVCSPSVGLLILYFCEYVFLFIGKQKAEENGEDYDRVKLLEKTADELERMERKRKKKNPDEGFSGWYGSK